MADGEQLALGLRMIYSAIGGGQALSALAGVSMDAIDASGTAIRSDTLRGTSPGDKTRVRISGPFGSQEWKRSCDAVALDCGCGNFVAPGIDSRAALG